MEELCKAKHALTLEALEFGEKLVKGTLSASDSKVLKAIVNKMNKLDREIYRQRQT